MNTYHATSEVVTTENYPYGYTLRTTKTDWIEFKRGKGFRHVSQTVNPKTGRLNNPKKSTYYPVMLLYTNEEGHVKTSTLAFYGEEGINNGAKFMFEHFNLFTEEQIKDIASYMIMTCKASVTALVQYCGANVDEVLPMFKPSVEALVNIVKTGENLFYQCILPIESIESTKVPDFNPFKVITHEIN